MPSAARSSRRRTTPIVVAVLVLLAVASAWIAFRALAAQRHLEAARTSLEEARAAGADQRLDDARAAVERAGADTAAARSLTGDPVWSVVAAIPWAGATLETARGLAVAADDLAREVVPAALDGVEQAEPERLRLPDGSVDLELVKQVTPTIVAGADGVAAVQADLAELPDRGVVGRVAAARQELEAQVDELATTLSGAATAVRLAPPLLGDDQLRRYLLVVQQTAEARGTGGLPGGWAVLEAEDGRLRVVETGTNATAPDGPVEPPEGLSDDFVARYRTFGAFGLWVNTNLSPDLPSVSRLFAARFAERGTPVDGVIALDAQALAAVLAGGEPLTLATGRQLPVDQLVEYLAVGQYADFTADPGSDVLSRADERREGLAEVAVQTAQRLFAGGGSSESLLRGLSEAVRSGHLRMASDDPALALLAEAGVDGALPALARPTAYAVVNGATGGKLDHFLDRSVRYEAGDCTTTYRDSRITVTLANRAPASGLPPYVTVRQAADGTYATSTDSAVTLSVYGSRGAVLERATLDGVELDPQDPSVPFLTRYDEGGLPAWAVPVELPRDKPRTLVLELSEPLLPGEALVPEQPLSRPLTTEVDVPVC